MLFHIESQNRSANETATDFSVNIQALMQHIAKGEGTVAFRDLSVPYTWYNIVDGYNNKFQVTFSDASTKIITIGVGNPSISTIIANIQAQMNVNTSGQVFAWSVSTTTGKISISVTAGSYTMAFGTNADPFVWRLLGAASASNVTWSSGLGIYTFPNVVAVERYKNLYLHVHGLGLYSHDFENFTNRASSIITKIPVVGPSVSFFGWIYFNPGRPSYRYSSALEPNLKIRLCDGAGIPIDLNGQDWTVTLEFVKN